MVEFLNTATFKLLKEAHTISNLPSPLISPISTPRGPAEVTRLLIGTKLRLPVLEVLRNTETSLVPLATDTMSSFPSLFKSPKATPPYALVTLTGIEINGPNVILPGPVVVLRSI